MTGLSAALWSSLGSLQVFRPSKRSLQKLGGVPPRLCSQLHHSTLCKLLGLH